MKPRTIQSVEGLLSIVQEYAHTSVIYRGVTSSKYKLIPKVGRRRRGGKILEPKGERYILSLFKHEPSHTCTGRPVMIGSGSPLLSITVSLHYRY